MDRETLLRLGQRLPNDATEIIVYGHDSVELSFNSSVDCKAIGAILTQKGTYKGPKRRWRLTDDYIAATIVQNLNQQLQPGDTIIDPQSIPYEE